MAKAGFKNPMKKRVYNTWYGMINRAAGRGRGNGRYVDPDWQRSFVVFLSEVGFPKSADQVLCLRDPEAGFYPGNVYWGSRKELQQYASHVRTVEHNGELLSLSEAARRLGIHRTSLRDRIKQQEKNKIHGDRLRELRKQHRISIASLSLHSEISEAELTKIEAGQAAAGKHRSVKIKDAMSILKRSASSRVTR